MHGPQFPGYSSADMSVMPIWSENHTKTPQMNLIYMKSGKPFLAVYSALVMQYDIDKVTRSNENVNARENAATNENNA